MEKLKGILIHLTEEEHQQLKKHKGKLTWKEYLLKGMGTHNDNN